MAAGKKPLAGIALFFIVLGQAFFFLYSQVSCEGQASEKHGAGLLPLTAQELETIRTKWPHVTKVGLNKLGLERVNSVRAKKSLPRLSESLSKPIGQEVLSSIGVTPIAQESVVEPAAGDLPVVVDNSLLKYFPPIRDQGLLNSCASFAIVYTQMSYMSAFQRDIDIRNNADNTNKYSPKWAYDMVNGGANGVSSVMTNYNLLKNHGACTWAEFPYDADYLGWCQNPSAWRNALEFRTNQAQTAGFLSDEYGLTQAKQLLNDGYVLVFSTFIDSWQWRKIEDDPATSEDDPQVGKDVCFWVNGYLTPHVMAIVGYNDAVWVDINNNDVIDAGEKGAFRVANSWGPWWKDQGFTWIAYDAFKWISDIDGAPHSGRVYAAQGDIAFFMTLRENYSPKVIAEFTVNHAKRNQLGMTLGSSDTNATIPATVWTPSAINFQGGPYAFDGSTTAVDGTFVFDFTDLLPVAETEQRYYVGMADNASGDAAELKSFKLIDLTSVPHAEVVSSLVPMSVDAGAVYSYVDYTFRSQTGAIALTAPNGGEWWIAGSSHDITWTTSGPIAGVRIELSVDNGSNWTDVAASTANTGNYSWTVPATYSTSCLIRVSDLTVPATSDLSDADFAIASPYAPPGPFALVDPEPGAILMRPGMISYVTLAWEPAGGAQYYQVFFGTGPEPPSFATTEGTSLSVEVASGHTYRWTVAACNSNDLTWATGGTRTFSVCRVVGEFAHLSPANGTTLPGGTTDVDLTWEEASGAESYDVYFGTSPNPPFCENRPNLSWTVPVSNGYTYYWRIQARNDCGSALGSSSGTWSFDVDMPARLWSPLTSGVNSYVGAIVATGETVYAGGDFWMAGGEPVEYVAKFDGAVWTALGGRTDNVVLALAKSDQTLYAGGAFLAAGGVAANHVAKWDGTAWTPLGAGTNQWITSLAVDGNILYAGGAFSEAGGMSANGVAKWDGASWSALGSGITGQVSALEVSDGALFAGGDFSEAGGAPAACIAKWDGVAWSTLGSGMNGAVRAIAAIDGDIYAGGSFTLAGGEAAPYIAKWNGAGWAPVGSGMNGPVYALAVIDGVLYAGGGFTEAGEGSAARIAKWDGTGWSPLSSGMNSDVLALDSSGRFLYAGGNFLEAGGLPAAHVARWKEEPRISKDDLLGTWDGQGVYYRHSDTAAWVKMASPATKIAVGDLDGDGIDDLIGLWPGQGGIWVKHSQSGAWAKLSSTAQYITAGDMNGDGRVDLVGTWDGQGVFYRNSITGAWVKMATPATMVAAGDIDNDGIDDLIGLWPSQGGIWVKYSQTGGWAKLSSTAVHITAGDMNGDGRDDLLGTWDGQGVYYRDSLSGAWIKMASSATLITTGDLDGDAIDDLIGIWPTQGGVWVKYSSDGTWERLSSTAQDIAAGKMRAAAGGGEALPEGVLTAQQELVELPLPMGGNEEGPGIALDKKDISNLGPGGARFVYIEDINLEPKDSANTQRLRAPGPGEAGAKWVEQMNLFPLEQIRNKKADWSPNSGSKEINKKP
jgi:hypothetical protein